jgi:hypothetical protein
MRLESTGWRLTGVRNRPLLQKLASFRQMLFRRTQQPLQERDETHRGLQNKRSGPPPPAPATHNFHDRRSNRHQRIFRTLLAGGAVTAEVY